MENLFKIIADGNLEAFKQYVNESNINLFNVNKMSLLQEALKNKQDEIALYLAQSRV